MRLDLLHKVVLLFNLLNSPAAEKLVALVE